MSASIAPPPPRGSEAEFLAAVRAWQPATHVAAMRVTEPVHRSASKHRGPAARAAAAAAAAAAADPATPSRYFVFLEQAPPSGAFVAATTTPPASAASASAAAAASSSAAAAASSSSSSATALRLLVSNLAGSWQALLDFSTMKKHREKLGVGSTPWADVLSMMRACLSDVGRVIVKHPPASAGAAAAASAGDDADDDDAFSAGDADVSRRPLTVVLRYNVVDFDIESDFVLQPVLPAPSDADAPSASLLSAPQQLQAHLLFGVFAAAANAEAAALAPMQTELSKAKREVQQLRDELATARASLHTLEAERSAGSWGAGGGLGYVPGAAGSQHHSYDDAGGAGGLGGGVGLGGSPAKRKAPVKPRNMSILNPNAKRRKVGAIKIGE